ncbi:hypothetical protein [Yersinia enterocolitica]|uniref:hypothetical protein n=1 Tax=Yersinia enterocolitica TaxID=630 RepID=UPI003AB5BB4F
MLSGGSSQLSFLSGFVSSRISVVVVVVLDILGVFRGEFWLASPFDLECGRKLVDGARILISGGGGGAKNPRLNSFYSPSGGSSVLF